MHKESCSLEQALQIIREVCGDNDLKRNKTKKNRRLVESDIDIFAAEKSKGEKP
ncbi:MAG: hypothetical protein ACYSTR_02825 [Planctomycetota bacterium]|jgi:hypothetical protein